MKLLIDKTDYEETIQLAKDMNQIYDKIVKIPYLSTNHNRKI